MSLANKLQNDLISRIGQIDDVNFLKAIQAILDISNKDVFELTELQKESIAESRQQIENGEGVGHKEVMGNLNAWLEKE